MIEYDVYLCRFHYASCIRHRKSGLKRLDEIIKSGEYEVVRDSITGEEFEDKNYDKVMKELEKKRCSYYEKYNAN